MTLTTKEIISIVFNDDQYIQHVNSHSLGENAHWKVIEIPRSSFTAFRLSYASPIELSLSSKTVLLGGIPSQWYHAQRNSIRNCLGKMKNSKLREKIGKESDYGIRAIYHEDKSALEQPLGESSKDTQRSTNCRKSSVTGPRQNPKEFRHASTTTVKDRICSLENKSQTSPFLPAIDFYRIASPGERPLLQREGYTSGDLPTVPLESTNVLRNWLTRNKDREDNAQDTAERSGKDDNHTIKNGDTSFDSSVEGLGAPYDNLREFSGLKDREKTLDQLYKEQEQNEKEMNRLLNTTNAYWDETKKDGQSDETYVSVISDPSDVKETERSAVPAASTTLPYTDPTISANEDAKVFESFNDRVNQSISFGIPLHLKGQKALIDDALESGLNDAQSTKRRVVFLKALASSKDFKKLSVLAPEPEKVPLSKVESHTRHERSSNYKLHGRRLKSANVKTKGIFSKFKQRASKKCGTYYSSHGHSDRKGPVLMMDKMLVMVKTAVNQRNPILDFSESEPLDTRVADRWREYIVIARQTNQPDRPILLQFCRHSSWHKNLQEQDPGSGNSLDFYLDKSCVVGLYSILDKTIFIEKPDDKYFDHYLGELHEFDDHDLSPLKFYILRCSTLMSSGKWNDFLRSAIGIKSMPSRISLRVPEAGVAFSVHFTQQLTRELEQMEIQERSILKIACLPRGYRVFQVPIIRYLLATVYDKLKDAGFTDVIKGWEKANVVMGVNFRHYDLINWCPGHQSHSLRSTCSLFQPHLLEFRPYAYCGRKLKLASGATVLEQTPIEGFLLRLTNQEGSDKDFLGNPHLIPTYFFTSENLLFSMAFAESTPPVPLELLISASDSLDPTALGDRLNEIPQVFEQNPYPLDLNSHIEWLNGTLDQEKFILNDFFAFKCFNRRIIQIIKSEAVIDLTEIGDIYQGSVTEVNSHELTYKSYALARSTFWRNEISVPETAKSIIILRHKNGLFLKLLAPNAAIGKEWVVRLKQLVFYWKEKQISELHKLWSTKMRNITNLQIEEEQEANVNGRTPKWVTDRGVTDPTIYNVNALAVLRPMLHKGILYQKPKKHAVFSKYMVVLVPGFLILYHSYRRSKTGFAKNSFDHRHYMTVPIEHCYVYSGTLTELDLLDRSRDFDELNPGTHALPRIYSDGWASSETETSRCFTLWFGKKRFLSRSSKNLQSEKDYQNEIPKMSDLKSEPQGGNTHNPNMLKMIRQLGVSGRSMVFMARSRQERDLWVLSLFYEMERLKNFE
ncbi:SPO71 (YDR104C) [Zygosaccharomyces parabailii]|nr:SPO71 (YDR104C) [Zygosaccharomyces parabailii]